MSKQGSVSEEVCSYVCMYVYVYVYVCVWGGGAAVVAVRAREWSERE